MAGYENDPYTCSTCWGIINIDGADMVPEDGSLCVCEDNPHRHWPTSEQFDQASTLGTEYALQERAGGATEGQEAPLSGEWADGMTERTIAGNVSYYPAYDSMEVGEDLTELGNAWENAYHDQWRVMQSEVSA